MGAAQIPSVPIRGGTPTNVRRRRFDAKPPVAVIPDAPGLTSLRPSAIWAFMRRQPLSFWFVLIYLFFEYVRPQQIYERIQGPPYARIAIIAALVVYLVEQRRLRFGMPEILLALFSVIVLLSSITGFQPSVSFDHIMDYFAWVVIYLLIANSADSEGRFFIFTLSFLIYSFKMSNFATRSWAQDGFVYRDWGTTGAPGFFQNSGEFGIQMCIFIPLLVAFVVALRDGWPRWLRWAWWGVGVTAILGIIGSSSRGALVGLAAVCLWMLLKSKHRLRGLLLLTVLAAAVYMIIPDEQKTRITEAGTDKTSISRTTYWKHGLEIMRDNPILGIGYANWSDYHEMHYGIRALPHNIFIEAGAELGYSGLAAFIALIGCTLVINRRTRKIAQQLGIRGRFLFYMANGLDGALVGFIASGFFITVLYYPFFWINLAMTVALNNAAQGAIGEVRAPNLSAARARNWRSGSYTAQGAG